MIATSMKILGGLDDNDDNNCGQIPLTALVTHTALS